MTYAIPNPTRSPGMDRNNGHTGPQSLRMVKGERTGRRQLRLVHGDCGCTDTGNDWPGKAYGIRRTDPAETPPSWEEVRMYFEGGPYQ